MARDLNDMNSMTCRLLIKKPIPSFDETITLNLYRIIQEALTNAVKHSMAENLLIVAGEAVVSDFYDFQVVDDGIGFQMDKSEFGVGIPSMRDRVNMLGGRFRIVSEKGQGTRIVVEVPAVDE